MAFQRCASETTRSMSFDQYSLYLATYLYLHFLADKQFPFYNQRVLGYWLLNELLNITWHYYRQTDRQTDTHTQSVYDLSWVSSSVSSIICNQDMYAHGSEMLTPLHKEIIVIWVSLLIAKCLQFHSIHRQLANN